MDTDETAILMLISRNEKQLVTNKLVCRDAEGIVRQKYITRSQNSKLFGTSKTNLRGMRVDFNEIIF